MHHKKYALAAKFFEYVFEPVIAEKNWIFYNLGFHRFINNLLYVWALAQNRTADQLMADFASAMRSLDPKDLPVFSAGHSLVIGGDDPLAHIGAFCLIHQKKIAEELVDLRDADDAPWMLDLTTTSLFSVLGYWGDRFDHSQSIVTIRSPWNARRSLNISSTARTSRINRSLATNAY
jgi:hypothetical protein